MALYTFHTRRIHVDGANGKCQEKGKIIVVDSFYRLSIKGHFALQRKLFEKVTMNFVTFYRSKLVNLKNEEMSHILVINFRLTTVIIFYVKIDKLINNYDTSMKQVFSK